MRRLISISSLGFPYHVKATVNPVIRIPLTINWIAQTDAWFDSSFYLNSEIFGIFVPPSYIKPSFRLKGIIILYLYLERILLMNFKGTSHFPLDSSQHAQQIQIYRYSSNYATRLHMSLKFWRLNMITLTVYWNQL